MAKTIGTLSNEGDYDFIVIGLVCQNRDYRLCHELNKALNIELGKKDNYSVYNNKRMEDHTFSFYEYLNEDEDRYNLISNKCSRGALLPEQKIIDYLFLIRPDKIRINQEELIKQLNKIKIILGVYPFDILKLKSKRNLLF